MELYNITKKLTKTEKKNLIAEICRLAEKQYRKGVQHGVLFAEEGFSFEDKEGNTKQGRYTSKEASEFRHYHPKKIKNGHYLYYHECPDPRQLAAFGKTKCNKWDPVERVSCELGYSPILNHLFLQ